jgi:hypothetical protein
VKRPGKNTIAIFVNSIITALLTHTKKRNPLQLYGTGWDIELVSLTESW